MMDDTTIPDVGFTYISFDPGKTTGIIGWDSNGKQRRAYELNIEQLDSFLLNLNRLEEEKSIKPEVFIIEEYVVYGHVNHTGSKVETAQVIGYLKGYARQGNITVVEQRATVQSTAALWSGVKKPKGHTPHWQSAFYHGYYYLHSIGIIKPRVLKDI